MAFIGVRPTHQVTEEVRRIFVALALESEVRDASLWSIVGDEQVMLRGRGSFRHSGRYLLKNVAKHWSKGHLYASTVSPREISSGKVYYAITDLAVLISTSKQALCTVAPDSNVEVLHGCGD